MDSSILFSRLFVHEEIINKRRIRKLLVTKQMLIENELLKSLDEFNEKGVMECL